MKERIKTVLPKDCSLYYVGQDFGESVVQSISVEEYAIGPLIEPHFVGRDLAGNVVFAINCNIPCIITYQ